MAENNKQVKRPKVKTFYSANKTCTLGSMDLSFNSKDGSVYLKMAPQKAYHDERKAKGEYDWPNAVNVKLDTGEVGALIRALRTDGEFTFIHDFEGNKTSGSCKFYKNEKGGRTYYGFGFSVKKGDREVKVPIGLGDGELIMEYLRFALDHIFSADYAVDKKYWEDRAKNNKPEVSTTVPEVDSPDAGVPEVAVDDSPF